MINDRFIPAKVQVLTEASRIKAYVHPTRMLIIDLLRQEKRRVSDVARELAVHPANLTHHFKLLEQAGLIRLVEKRDTGKNLEKYYRAAAYHFRVNLQSKPPAAKRELVLSLLRDDLAAAINMLPDGGEQGVLGVLETARIREADLALFREKFQALCREFRQRDTAAGRAYCLAGALYPNPVPARPGPELILE